MDARVHVGKAGLSEGLIAAMEEALARAELVKVRFDAFKDEKIALSEELAVRTQSALIARVGHVAVFFRRKPAEDSDDGE